MISLEKRLLNDFQRDFSLQARPFERLAEQLDCSEQEVLDTLKRLQETGAISRIGPVFAPRRLGASTLAAMAVPEARLGQVAALVSAYDEVNHNYEREHYFNLWFVVTAKDRARLEAVLCEIEAHSGLEVMSLPLLKAYHIDLGFKLELA